MPILDALKVRKSLVKKGFIPEEGDHYYFHYLDDRGKKTKAWTKISHSADDINNPLIKKMAMQTQLSKEEFLDLVNCPLSKEQYRDILREKGILE